MEKKKNSQEDLDQKEFINFLEDGNQINLENLEPEDFRKLPWKQKLKLKKLVEVLIKKIKKNKILIIKIILGASVSILVLYFVLPLFCLTLILSYPS
jgi:hypothetical protein